MPQASGGEARGTKQAAELCFEAAAAAAAFPYCLLPPPARSEAGEIGVSPAVSAWPCLAWLGSRLPLLLPPGGGSIAAARPAGIVAPPQT